MPCRRGFSVDSPFVTQGCRRSRRRGRGRKRGRSVIRSSNTGRLPLLDLSFRLVRAGSLDGFHHGKMCFFTAAETVLKSTAADSGRDGLRREGREGHGCQGQEGKGVGRDHGDD